MHILASPIILFKGKIHNRQSEDIPKDRGKHGTSKVNMPKCECIEMKVADSGMKF